MATKIKRKKKAKAPLTEEQILKREKATFKRKIKNIFCGMGFESVPTNDHHIFMGHRDIEIDSLFIYENIWLICEDTVKDTAKKMTHVREHIRTKNEAFGIIKTNKQAYLDKLLELFPEKKELLQKYDLSRVKIFGLYISKNELFLSGDDHELFDNLIFIQPKILEYFAWISKCIKHSARNEVFKFLGLERKDIGIVSGSGSSENITAPIIYPREFTGLKNGVRIVSFMMSAEKLLETCYVLRKDNWSDSMWLYQRLIKPHKIKKMRSFIEHNGAAFYNNIIVALPDNVVFKDASGKYKGINEIGNLEGNCELILPNEMNSICVIDGQHRIFAHYESGSDSAQEKIIADLRKKLHLLVTGLVFPENMPMEERIQFQSKIFHDINSTVDPVSQHILLQIKRIRNPLDDESLAQLVIEKLNREGVFKNLFQMSSLEKGKIKTASIVRFALRYLVTITPAEGKQSLYNYWDGDKGELLKGKDDAINKYAEFCSKSIREYFAAVKTTFDEYWVMDSTSKLLSVISLNGFIIAYTRQLSINGVKTFMDYHDLFSGCKIDFSSDKFGYTSSQYRKFSTELLEKLFGLSKEVIKDI